MKHLMRIQCQRRSVLGADLVETFKRQSGGLALLIGLFRGPFDGMSCTIVEQARDGIPDHLALNPSSPAFDWKGPPPFLPAPPVR